MGKRQLFLAISVNGGKGFKVTGSSLKAVRRRLGLRYLVQELPRTCDTIITRKEDISLYSL